MTNEISNELRQEFIKLADQLNPDTLLPTADTPDTEVHAQLRRAHAQWAKLEKRAGRSIKVEEVLEWIVDGMNPLKFLDQV